LAGRLRWANGKPARKRQLGKPRHRWKDIRMGLRGVE